MFKNLLLWVIYLTFIAKLILYVVQKCNESPIIGNWISSLIKFINSSNSLDAALILLETFFFTCLEGNCVSFNINKGGICLRQRRYLTRNSVYYKTLGKLKRKRVGYDVACILNVEEIEIKTPDFMLQLII